MKIRKNLLNSLGKFRNNKYFLIIAVCVLGSVTIILTLIWSQTAKKSDSKNNSASITVSDSCESKNTITYGCYKNELTVLTEDESPKQAFDLLKSQYNKESYVKSECHQLAHVIGRAAYIKYANLTNTFSNGDQFCWSGYYHGAMEELTKTKGFNFIFNNSNAICKTLVQKQRYSFNHYNCVHGLGHGFMLVLKGDLFKSLSSCDTLNDEWERSSCYGGVFMQNIMNEQGPDANSDGETVYLRTNDPMYPCTIVAEKYKDQCYLMQTSYALQLANYDFTTGFKECSQIETPFISTCYKSLGRDASGSSISNVKITHDRCSLGPTPQAQANCLEGAVKDFVSYFHNDQQANELCNSFDSQLKENCRSIVKSYYATF